MKATLPIIFFSIFFMFPVSNCFAQEPGIEWQNTIAGSNDDHLFCVQQTTDGGYILGGDSKSGISGDKTEINLGYSDYWVVKLNNAGAWNYCGRTSNFY